MTETQQEAASGQTPPETSPASVLHLVDPSALTTLEELQSSANLAGGHINIISFEAIAERLGRRWPSRRELVYEHAQRTLHRQVGPGAFHRRISDTDFVVVQPQSSRLAAQALCLNALRETLHHFLGEALNSDIIVHEVTRITPDGVYGERLDVVKVEEEELRERAQVAAQAGKVGSLEQWSPFVASDGRRVRVSCALEPVFHLKTSQRIGYRMARRVLEMPTERPLTPTEQRNLSRPDIEKVDFATLSRGLDRLRNDGEAEKQPSLILPVSYATLSSQRGRSVLIEFFKEAQDSVRHGLICEVCDIEGVPPGVLLAATALIRPLCLFVVGRLDETPTGSLRGFKDAGLQGVSIECPDMAGDAEFIGWMRLVVTAAKPVAKSMIVYRLASLRQAAMAGMLGVTHGSLRPAAPAAVVLDS